MPDLKSCKVLVTPTSYGKSDSRLKTDLEAAVGEVVYNPTGKPLSAEKVREMIPGCHGYIAGLDQIDKGVFEVADELKVIARYGAGVDRVDLEAARSKGVVVTNTPGANSVSVAELAIGLMLALARNLPVANAATKRGEWPRLRGVSLEGKTVGLLGLGTIGKEVAKRLAGFSCRIAAHDPYADEKFAKKHGVDLVSLDELLAASDFLSLHVPVLDDTRGMVDAGFLARMKKGSFLVNTARGELLEEAALLEALKSEHLRGAALDAFETEPPSADNPLLALENVIGTPHTGAHSDSATNGMGWGSLNDCLAVLRGEKPKFPVT